MMSDSDVELEHVAVRHGVVDQPGQDVEVPAQNARGVHERDVEKAYLEVRDVHGQRVHGVFAQVRGRQAVRPRRQHVHERERERVPGADAVGRERVQPGHQHEAVGRDQVVPGDHADGGPVRGRRAAGVRGPVAHVAERGALVQPDRHAQQQETLDQQAQHAVQLHGQVDVLGAGHRRARGREQERGERVLAVRQVHHARRARRATGHPHERVDRVHAKRTHVAANARTRNVRETIAVRRVGTVSPQ